MKRTKMLSIAIALAALLALSAGLMAQPLLSLAQGPGPADGGSVTAPLGTAFTYQGELNKDGDPVNGTCQMQFSLYDAASSGNLVGGPLTHNVTVTDGRFTSVLSFSGSPFTGQARWLEIAVQCPGDADFSTLSPRQPLTATPYALGLRPGALIQADGAGEKLFTVSNTSAGTFSDGIYGRTASTAGSGVVAYASSPSGETFGVWAESVSTEGRGVYGYASATSGNGQGVRGDSESSTNGVGVYGYAAAISGTNYGVFGRSASPDGQGVQGTAPTYGVYGRASRTSGSAYGVYGEALSTLGGAGVYGTSPHYGVYGDGSVGVYGRSDSTIGHGVHAFVGSTSGETRAIYAQARSPDGWAGYFMTSYGNGVHITSNSGKVGLEVAGGSKNAVVRTADGSRLLYSEESTAVWFSDYGFGQLQDGVATVPIDPIFAQTVNLDEPYHVFVQVYGDAEVYVSERTSTQFEVHLREGDPDVEFSYRIVATRLGFEGQRLERAPWADKDPNLYPELLDSPGGEP